MRDTTGNWRAVSVLRKELSMIVCDWDHEDCFAARTKTRYGKATIYCDCLVDCDFPDRKDCPFYKKGKTIPVKREDAVIPFGWKGEE